MSVCASIAWKHHDSHVSIAQACSLTELLSNHNWRTRRPRTSRWIGFLARFSIFERLRETNDFPCELTISVLKRFLSQYSAILSITLFASFIVLLFHHHHHHHPTWYFTETRTTGMSGTPCKCILSCLEVWCFFFYSVILDLVGWNNVRLSCILWIVLISSILLLQCSLAGRRNHTNGTYPTMAFVNY